jgi:beta-phosphoglucomutase family hydrolase
MANAGLRNAQRSEERSRRVGLPGPIRACLFDLDGVITRTMTLHEAAWKQAFDELLAAWARRLETPYRPFEEPRDFERHLDGRPRLDGVRAFLASRGITLPEGSPGDPSSAETIRGLARRKSELFEALLDEHGVALYPGSVRYLRAVRGAGLRTAIVSSSESCAPILARAGIAELFEVRIDGAIARERHLRGKPEPDTYLAAARAFGFDPPLCAVFEDALAGVEAGRRGGFGFVLGIDRLGHRSALLEHGAHQVVEDLAELLEGA